MKRRENTGRSKKNSKNKSGFTALEIAVCLVIVGFFSTMAVPMFRNFMVRSKMTELRGLAHGATLSIVEFMQLHGRLPNDSSEVDFRILGVPKYLQDISWDQDALTLTGDADKMGLQQGEEVSLIYRAVVRNGGIAWTCETVGPSKYAPEGCPTL